MNNPDDDCDINTMGTITFDGQEVTVTKPVFKDYGRYNSGFLFKHFATNLYDSNGTRVHEHPVIDWIRAQAHPRQAVH
jgi:hypothetical protein